MSMWSKVTLLDFNPRAPPSLASATAMCTMLVSSLSSKSVTGGRPFIMSITSPDHLSWGLKRECSSSIASGSTSAYMRHCPCCRDRVGGTSRGEYLGDDVGVLGCRGKEPRNEGLLCLDGESTCKSRDADRSASCSSRKSIPPDSSGSSCSKSSSTSYALA